MSSSSSILRVSAGPGARGEREYDWAWATVSNFGDVPVGFAWTLLARRSIEDPTDIAYHLCFHPDSVEQEEVVRVAGARWAIEECFQAAKNECGLDHYQVRKWNGWYRHITIAMLAHAFLTATAASDPKAHAGWETSQSPRSVVSWRQCSTPPAPSNKPWPPPGGDCDTKPAHANRTTSRNARPITDYGCHDSGPLASAASIRSIFESGQTPNLAPCGSGSASALHR
ncbi:transposase [Glycomyces xiaoerkulensis]|uniref:transposase n=1 Tax=Glycomyces xiaoerkulensis TaxID=2038139 RepID=UPI000DEEA5B8